MLSYRHGFHAGNFTDVHKHVVLILLLEHLLEKDTPYCYLDTHAGAGTYDLQSRFAATNREFETGIARLWDAADCPPAVARYLEVVRLFNRDALRTYPGSPAIARRFLRPHDRMILSELHNSEAPQLRQCFARDRQVAVHHRDGFEALPALVPPRERRGVVLIDPSYELRNEFITATDSLTGAWRRWPTGTYLLWYPLQRRQPIEPFKRAVRKSPIRKVLSSELLLGPDRAASRLSGSGLLIVNPPWRLDHTLRGTLPWLEQKLEWGEHAASRTEWLVPE